MLDESKLVNVRRTQNKTTAQCPACAESGMDTRGNHLVIYPSGQFGCVANPGDSDHRSQIWALVGLADSAPLPAQTGKFINFKHSQPSRTLRTVDFESKATAASIRPAHTGRTGAADPARSSEQPNTGRTGEANSVQGSEQPNTGRTGEANSVQGSEQPNTGRTAKNESVEGNAPLDASFTYGSDASFPIRYISNKSNNKGVINSKQATAHSTELCQIEPSDPYDSSTTTYAIELFAGQAKAIPAGGPIPIDVVGVLATWKALREHPAWHGNEQIAEYLARGRVVGWRRSGQKIFAQK